MDLIQRERPEIFGGIGLKSDIRLTKALISLKRSNIGPRLLLRTNRKSLTRFRLVPKSTTLDDLEGSLYTLVCILFQNMHHYSLLIYCIYGVQKYTNRTYRKQHAAITIKKCAIVSQRNKYE